MKPAHALLNEADSHGHFVQFYKADEPGLNRNVATFLWEGLLKGDGLLMIASSQRRESVASHLVRLGADVSLARREGQLAMLDAHEMLSRIMVAGEPDENRFREAIGEALQHAQPRSADAGICAYGEMVGILWEAGQSEAAIQLEACWNRLLHDGRIKLFCGYPIDIFADDLRSAPVHHVLCAHTRLLPTGSNSHLNDALYRAIDEHLGARADEVRLSMRAYIPASDSVLPTAERAILWLQSNLPEHAGPILACARNYYEEAGTPE
jgi:hypothetical protein